MRWLAALVLTLAGCGTAGLTPGTSPTGPAPTSPAPTSTAPTSTAPTIPGLTVAGRWIPASGVTDVADALAVAHVVVPYGRLLSIVRHRVLDARAAPGSVRLNGAPAALATRVHADDVVTVVPGADRVERTVHVTVPVRLPAAAARLYASVRPGAADAVVGSVSRERVSTFVVRAPTVGRLRTPAHLSLTIDDGPDATWTPKVLAQIAAHRVPVVFCLIGAAATAHPDLVRREVAAGATLCDHTQTHPRDLPSLSPARIAAEISTGLISITKASGGVHPTYFRAPGGNWSSLVEADAVKEGLSLLRWSVDPKDWSRPGVAAIETRVLEQLRPGGVVLLHDGGGDRSQTVAAMTALLDELSAAGWTFTLPPRVTAVVTARLSES